MKMVVGANVKALVKARDRDFNSACKRLGMKVTQLKRVIAGKHAITMDTLERIADGYGVEPYQLLIPDFDPLNPRLPRVLSPEDEIIYHALAKARQAGPGTQ